jgi:hypothetical protein
MIILIKIFWLLGSYKIDIDDCKRNEIFFAYLICLEFCDYLSIKLTFIF